MGRKEKISRNPTFYIFRILIIDILGFKKSYIEKLDIIPWKSLTNVFIAMY